MVKLVVSDGATLAATGLAIGAGGAFWLPGGTEALARWQSETDAIWSRDLNRYRADAVLTEQNLHQALAPETFVQRP